MLIKFSELPIPFGRLALGEVFSQAVSMNVADYLGVDNWQGWRDMDGALEELYPDYAQGYDSCLGVAEAIIYDWMNNASKTK